jgi:hypothetical protein
LKSVLIISMLLFNTNSIGYATSAIRHLTKIGTINPHEDNSQPGKRVFRPKSEDAPLLLSKQAQDRAYFPEGILNHHHAIQYITFSPPFESIAPGMSNYHHNQLHPGSRECSQNSYSPMRSSSIQSLQSHDDDHTNASSLGSDGVSQYGLGQNRNTSTVAALTTITSSKHNAASPRSPTSVTNPPNYTKGRVAVPLRGIEIEGDPALLSSSSRRQSRQQDQQQNYKQSEVDGIRIGKTKGIFSRLNCCRNNEEGQLGGTTGAYRDHPNETTMTSLSEEEEQRWLAYSMRTIAEDQSLAGGQSVVSVSAPLLSSSSSPNRTNNSSRRTCQQQMQQNHHRHHLQRLGSGRGYKGLSSTEYEV